MGEEHVHRGDAQDPPHEETALRAKVSGFCSQRGGRQKNGTTAFVTIWTQTMIAKQCFVIFGPLLLSKHVEDG